MPQNKEFFHSKTKTVGSAFSLHARGNASGGRSLGLITELQDYIEVLENVAASRKVELEKVRDDKHGVERMLNNFQQKDGSLRQAELFTSLARCDLPPRLRAILEDNRMLADKVRQYKSKCATAERMMAEQRRHFTQYHDQICKLKREAKGQSPRTARKGFSETKKICELEYQLNILKKKNQTDSKVNQRLISGLRKENEMLYLRIETLKSSAAEKDREVRMHVIELKQLQRAHLEEKRIWHQSRRSRGARASTAPLPSTEFVKEDNKIVAPKDEEGHLIPGTEEQKDLNKPEPYVMLCIVRDSSEPSTFLPATAPESGHKPDKFIDPDPDPTESMSQAQAATLIQSQYRGYKARQCEAQHRNCAVVTSLQTKLLDGGRPKKFISEKEQSADVPARPRGETSHDRAAVAIQSAVRGMQARKRVDRMRVNKVAADASYSHKIKSTAHQSNWIYRHQQDSKQSKSVLVGGRKKLQG